MLIIAVILMAAYVAMTFIFCRGWKSITLTTTNATTDNTTKVSLVIALYNEEKNVQALLSSLSLQTFANFELIMVDDCSNDNTLTILKNGIAAFSNVKIIELKGKKGKKHAISEGMFSAQGDLIITTDADCHHPTRWIESIVNCYNSHKPDFISAPVQICGNNTLLGNLQETEFMSLAASGAGAIGAGRPIMCNAANMAFTREAWNQSREYLRYETISGDDVFLLLSVKKHGKKILFLKNKDAIVSTQPKASLNDFFRQRIRWSGKAKFYTDKDIVTVSMLVFAVCLIQLVLLLLSLINPSYFIYFTAIFILKFLSDYYFLFWVNKFFDVKNLFWKSALLSIVYPFYIVTVASFSFFGKKSKW